MVENASNWTFIDQMREPSGGGILRAIGEPYIAPLGDFGWIFYVSLLSIAMVMAYQRSRDMYAPMFVLLVAGAVMSSLLGATARNIGNLLVALSLAGLLIKVWWQRRG